MKGLAPAYGRGMIVVSVANDNSGKRLARSCVAIVGPAARAGAAITDPGEATFESLNPRTEHNSLQRGPNSVIAVAFAELACLSLSS